MRASQAKTVLGLFTAVCVFFFSPSLVKSNAAGGGGVGGWCVGVGVGVGVCIKRARLFFLVTQLGSLGWMRGVVFPTWLALISMLFTFLESRMQYYQVYYI